MAIVVRFEDPVDAAHIVNGMHAAATLMERRNPELADRFRGIADAVGAGLDDGLPVPSGWAAGDREVPSLGRRADAEGEVA